MMAPAKPTGSTAIHDVYSIYRGSDGDATRAFLGRLEQLGELGRIAAYLFRAQKASERAKVYRGRTHRASAYDRKDWALRELAAVLVADAPASIVWGWGEDPAQEFHRHVLYVDLPTGQVSFHTGQRGEGPEYVDGWDGQRGKSPDRILRWIARLLEGRG